MTDGTDQQIREAAIELLIKSGFPITDLEQKALEVNDFGLGNIRKEGFQFIDILRSDRLRITVHVFLPNQTLPQHKHPSYGDEIGKEETLRVIWGQVNVFIEGDNVDKSIQIPEGKQPYYTALKQVTLNRGAQFTVMPGMDHWFQGGPEGAVALAFQNRVDENKNIFYDPGSLGCPIPNKAD